MPETYTIKISKGNGEISSNLLNTGDTNGDINQSNEKGNFGAAQALASQYAKRMLQEGISQYFDYSGGTIMQRKVNEGVGLGMDFYTMSSSPAGMIAVMYKWIMEAINEDKRIKKANDETNAKNEMLGVIIKDGGRFNNGNRY